MANSIPKEDIYRFRTFVPNYQAVGNILAPSLIPLTVGRVPTKWLLDNMHRIDREDFYSQNISEDELKIKYGESAIG